VTVDECKGKTPSEILRFLRAEGGHSLLIKGKAGTGKTTLALQIIEELCSEQRDYYLSTRVSDESLYRQFPWLREKARRNEILKAGKTFLTKARGSAQREKGEGGEVMRAAQDLLKAFTKSHREYMVVRSELRKLEGQIESGELDDEGEGYAVELESGSLTFDLGVILPEIELAYDLVEAHLPDRTLVVIDSIEALSERYGISAQRIMSTIQKDLVEQSGTNVVYVMETWKDTSLDYLGDGVVILEDDEMEGRRVRRLIIEKLRGSRIDRWKYMFTLLDGRVTVFEPTPPPLTIPLPRHEPIEDPSSGKVSMGDEGFDRVFGGLSKGTLTLLEIGKGVTQDILRRMEHLIMADFIAKGRGVVWYPLYSVDYHSLRTDMSQLVGGDLDKCLRVLDRDPYSETKVPFVSVIEGSEASHDLGWSTLRYLLSNASTPFLSLLGYDMLESVYGEGVVRETAGHIDAMRRGGNVVVAEATSDFRSLASLANQAHLHIRLESVDGTVMVCGRKPYTLYYHLTFRRGERPYLIPMV